MSHDGKRVFLVRPGDILLIGGLTNMQPEDLAIADTILNKMGFMGVYFNNDIDVALLTREQLAGLKERSDMVAQEHNDSAPAVPEDCANGK
jgi:hypothetical protein